MTRIATPLTQQRYNDPYQQRILQFDNIDSKVYLSRTSNFILKSIATDAIIKGFDISSLTMSNNIVTITLTPGLLIQDTTLIDVPESVALTFDVSSYDSCYGCLIIYTNYQYISSIEQNQLRLKISYISNDGLTLGPSTDDWNINSNRIYITTVSFNKEDQTVQEITFPEHQYIKGYKYNKKGSINFLPIDRIQNDTLYYELPHDFDSRAIISHLYDENLNKIKISNLYLYDEDTLKISLDEYKPIEDRYYQLFINNPQDSAIYEVESANIFEDDNSVYTLSHFLGQQYVQVQVYDVDYTLVNPRYIQLYDSDTIKIDFSNFRYNLAAKYYVVITKDNISTETISSEDFTSEQIEVQHNLNKLYITAQLVDSNNIIINTNNSVIQLNDSNSILFNTSICEIVPSDYRFIFYRNITTIFNLYEQEQYTRPYHMFVRRFNRDDLDSSYSLTVQHNLLVDYPIVQVFDENFNLIQPDFIQSIDAYSVQIRYNTITELTDENYLVIYAYNQQVESFDVSELDENNEITISFPDILSDPVIQIYNQDRELIIPDEIFQNSITDYTIKFQEDPDLLSFVVTGTTGFESYTLEFTEADLAANKIIITHNLNTNYPVFQLYYNDYIVQPNNIRILNNNQLELDLIDFNLTPTQYFKIIVLTGIENQAHIIRYTDCVVVEFDESNLISSRLTIDHNLNFFPPIVQVYDNENKMIMPDEIIASSRNRVILDFKSYSNVDSFFKAIIMKGMRNQIQSTTIVYNTTVNTVPE